MRKMAQIEKGLLYKHKDLILVPQCPDKKNCAWCQASVTLNTDGFLQLTGQLA